MQNMDHLVRLEVLELYDNKIREIKHFSQFVNLRSSSFCLFICRVLDLSFNKIKEIPDMSSLKNLQELCVRSASSTLDIWRVTISKI